MLWTESYPGYPAMRADHTTSTQRNTQGLAPACRCGCASCCIPWPYTALCQQASAGEALKPSATACGVHNLLLRCEAGRRGPHLNASRQAVGRIVPCVLAMHGSLLLLSDRFLRLPFGQGYAIGISRTSCTDNECAKQRLNLLAHRPAVHLEGWMGPEGGQEAGGGPVAAG